MIVLQIKRKFSYVWNMETVLYLQQKVNVPDTEAAESRSHSHPILQDLFSVILRGKYSGKTISELISDKGSSHNPKFG
jgi:hypothetical protein